MTRQKRGRNWENVLEGVCVAGVMYAYVAYLRVRNAGRKLLGVARTPLEVWRLVRRLRGTKRTGVVDVYQVQGCGARGGRATRRRNHAAVHKVASYPLRNL